MTLQLIGIKWNPSGFQELEVRKGDESYGVNLVTKQCQCRFWTISGISCVHAVAGYMHLNRDPYVGVSEWGRGKGSRGGGRGAKGAARGGTGRGGTKEEKRMARDKEVLERQDKEALQQALEEEREYHRQDE
ncbi:zinc finger, PMZ-type containing protein, partial [Tanacetum coccineum]